MGSLVGEGICSAHVKAEPLLLRDRCEGENRGAGEQRACVRQGAMNWKSRRDSPYIMILRRRTTREAREVREVWARSPTERMGRARTVVHGVADTAARACERRTLSDAVCAMRRRRGARRFFDLSYETGKAKGERETMVA